MTISDLKGVIDFEFDFADNEIDATFYVDINDIRDEYARGIEVVRIDRDVVVCRFTEFLRRRAYLSGALRKYINGAYYDDDPTKVGLQKQLLMTTWERANGGDITDDGGEAIAYFLEYDIGEFLTTDIKKYE